MLIILSEGDGVCEGVRVVGVGGADRPFMADCRGGEGGRVEDEWRLFVKRRETEAVAVEVPCVGAERGGDSSEGRTGDFGRITGCFSRIVRRDSRVRSTCISEEEESEEAESSSITGMDLVN